VAEEWVVLKFGGTSVAAKPQWETIATLARDRSREDCRVLLVCSALAGVTDRLHTLANQTALRDPDRHGGVMELDAEIIEDIMGRHRDLAGELAVDADQWLEQAEDMLGRSLASMAGPDALQAHAEVLSLGEWLSTRIGAEFLGQTLKTDWVDAREALEVVREEDLSPSRQWLSARCEAGIDQELRTRWSALAPVLITQGYVAGTCDGGTALLGRGGSDTSAALLAGRLDARRLEIWTDVPGLFSADPRLIPEARLLEQLDYAEALEMAASGAGVVQSRCIRAAAATATPIQIRDSGNPALSGTQIGQRASNGEGVKAITCQRDMAVLLLQNLDTRHQVGFLAWVFDVFRRKGISIDLVATSETTTTVALNCRANHLEAHDLAVLADELADRCKVELYSDCVCVNLVGRGARTALARLQTTMSHFDDHALLMLSFSANDLCLSLLVRAGEEESLLRSAHAALIPATNGSDSAFGSSWRELRSGS
jgi:diaminopimelate decarboxylase/aspartate kinase